MSPNALTLLPARARQIIYVLYGLVALTVAATAVGYNSLDLPNPPWLVVAGAVVSFLAVPFSALASLNVSATPANTPLADSQIGASRSTSNERGSQLERDRDGDGHDDKTGWFVPKE